MAPQDGAAVVGAAVVGVVVGGVVGVGAGALLGPDVAHADPAGPTDYRTEIVAIEPATDAIEIVVEGGDAFLHVTVEPGHEVVVLGYDGEPYLRIGPDGAVDQNRDPANRRQRRCTRLGTGRAGWRMGVARPPRPLDGRRATDRARTG